MPARRPWRTCSSVTLAALLAGACADAIPTEPTGPADRMLAPSGQQAAHRTDGDEALPFHLRGNAVLLHQEFAPGFPAQLSVFDGRCSVPSHFVLRFSLAGQATGAGNVTAVLEHCTQLDPQSGSSSITDGEMIITAANGDELWTNYGRELGGEERLVFVGGTGRFVEAVGEAVVKAVCNQAAGTCVVTMDGAIAYDASDRAR